MVVGSEKAQFAGTRDGLGAAFDLQLVENIAVMPFDGAQGEEQPLGDLFIRQTLGDQLQDFELAGGQRIN